MSDLIELECRYHAGQEATGQCEDCGDYLCDDCRAIIRERSYCFDCLGRRLRPPLTRHWVTIYLVIACMVSVVGWLSITFVDTESAVVSGPMAFILGVFGVIMGLSRGRHSITTVGASLVFITGALVFLVNAFNWSPRRAHDPFAIIIGVYVLFLLAYSAAAIADSRAKARLEGDEPPRPWFRRP